MTTTKVQNSSRISNTKTPTLGVAFRARTGKNFDTIEVRITYNSKGYTKSTGLKCPKGSLKGNQVKNDIQLSSTLRGYESNLRTAYHKLLEKGQIIDLERIFSCITGESVFGETPDLCLLIDKYIEKRYLQEGAEFDKATQTKNARYGKHLKQWVEQHFERKIVNLNEIKPAHEIEIMNFIKNGREFTAGNNHAIRYVRLIKACFNYAIANEWINYNPFMNFKPKIDKPQIVYLDKDELTRFETIKLSKGSSLERVRDLFAFCCYTGLSYIDLGKLNYSDIKENSDGKKYIQIPRAKTKEESIIPIFDDRPLSIIEKYSGGESESKIFSVPTNQQMNRLLKELAEMAFIEKKLTFHISRKTCGTILASAGVEMAIIQKVLGHASINTTIKYYAHLSPNAVINAVTKAIK